MNDDYIIKQAEQERDEFLRSRRTSQNSIPPLETPRISVAETNYFDSHSS